MKSLQEVIEPQLPSLAVTSSSSALGSPASSLSPMASSSHEKPTKVSNSKKKRYKDVKKMEQRVKTALAEGRIEDESYLEGIRIEKVVSPASTKQAMIARVSVIG
jgi:ubiquitin carboxyl-terminal hydrolase 1